MRKPAAILSLALLPILAQAQMAAPASSPVAFVVDEFGFDADAVTDTAPAPSRPVHPVAKGGALMAAGLVAGVLGTGILAASSMDECDPETPEYGFCSETGSSGSGQFLGGLGLIGGLILFVSGAVTMSSEP